MVSSLAACFQRVYFLLLIRLCGLDQFGKSFCIVDGDVGQDLAVQGDTGLLQTKHEAAIGNIVQTAGRVDTGDPQSAEVSLLTAASDLCGTLCAHDRCFRGTILRRTGTVVALSQFQNFLMSFTCVQSTFNSCHILILLKVCSYLQ